MIQIKVDSIVEKNININILNSIYEAWERNDKKAQHSNNVKERKDILIVCKSTLGSVCYPLIKRTFFALIKNSVSMLCVC